MKKILQLFSIGLLTIPSFVCAQKGHWTATTESAFTVQGTRYIQPSRYLVFTLNSTALKQQLANVTHLGGASYNPVYIDLPKPDGTFGTYEVYENETMSPELAAKFPEIKSYDGVPTNNSGEVVKLDFTPQGFHAMFLIPGQATAFIDPYSFGGNDIEHYIVYSKKDFKTDKIFNCGVSSNLEDKETMDETVKSFGDCKKRTYRVAIAATAEYTTFQGGTVALAQAAQVTTMNRVNGVYMREFAVTMIIVGNNNLLIYTNSGTDPYTNGNPGSMISQNQTNVTSVIGSANFDIGHVFGTNSGGLAGLGVVCSNSQKAGGVTGSGAPVGDPFDIDYVAHEMGHQFSGNHSFRGASGSCAGNGNNATAMEPGSGSSIMAYAGICAPQNVQNNSDDYFHAVSLNEMHNFIVNGGNTCAVQSVIPSQSSPTITIVSSAITVPISTPFALTASGTDPEGDVLTFCWEQMDNQNSTQPPVATSTNGPNFRTFDPQTSGTRYFPSIGTQLSTSSNKWEILPSVSRTMNFRCTVRDNGANGGCNDFGSTTVTTSANAGPFVVTYPNNAGINWQINDTRTVTWDVANTTAAPVSCSLVDIFLSTDNGLNFTLLADNVTNDGSEPILVPNTPSTTALIMVMSSNGAFFDISNKVFTISTDPSCNNPTVPTISGVTLVCAGQSTTLSIASGTLGDATQWQWYSGTCNGTPFGTGTSINVVTPGSYFVRGEGGCASQGNCAASNVNQINVNVSVTTQNGTLKANQVNAQYQWLNCDNNQSIISGATSQSFQPSANGNYAVIVTYGGCPDTSSCISYGSLGLTNENIPNFELFPNPTSGKITLAFNESQTITALVLTDITGRIIRGEENLTTQNIEFDLTNEAKGVYFVTVNISGKAQTMKLLKN